MSTKATLSHHGFNDDEPSWHLYEEIFEGGVVYLELRGVSAELRTRDQGGANVTLRLPIETAKQLSDFILAFRQRSGNTCARTRTGVVA